MSSVIGVPKSANERERTRTSARLQGDKSSTRRALRGKRPYSVGFSRAPSTSPTLSANFRIALHVPHGQIVAVRQEPAISRDAHLFGCVNTDVPPGDWMRRARPTQRSWPSRVAPADRCEWLLPLTPVARAIAIFIPLIIPPREVSGLPSPGANNSKNR
jgi:hypothetical protein